MSLVDEPGRQVLKTIDGPLALNFAPKFSGDAL